MKTPQVPIAKEGYPFILFSGFVTLIFTFLGNCWLAYLGIIITTFILWFFRDPERFITEKPNAIVSPADGKVIVIEKVEDNQFLHAEVYKVSIFMNIFNVHVNRLPLAGTIEKIIYSPGKFYSADSQEGLIHNESCTTVLQAENGAKIAIAQVAGLIARRIVNWLEIGDTIKKGDRFGLIRFGSRVDIYLPADMVIAVEVGQKVHAGETVVGYLST